MTTKEYVTEEKCWDRYSDLRDDIARLTDKCDRVEHRLIAGRVFLVSTVFGLGCSILGYAMVRADGWTSYVESFAFAAGVGIAGSIVAAIWVAIFNSR